MPDEAELKKLLLEHGIPVSGCVAPDADGNNQFYVFVDVTKNENNLQNPSNRHLSETRNDFAVMGIQIDFILIDDTNRDIETGVRASLLHNYGSYIRNSFLSTDGDVAYIWLDPKRNIPADEKKRSNIESLRC